MLLLVSLLSVAVLGLSRCQGSSQAKCCADASQDATAAPLWGQLLTAQLQLLAADRPANGGDESAEEPEESVGEPATLGQVPPPAVSPTLTLTFIGALQSWPAVLGGSLPVVCYQATTATSASRWPSQGAFSRYDMLLLHRSLVVPLQPAVLSSYAQATARRTRSCTTQRAQSATRCRRWRTRERTWRNGSGRWQQRSRLGRCAGRRTP